MLEDGRISALGPHGAERPRHPEGMPVSDHRGRLLLAGLVDAHVHYPQLGMVGAPAPDLLSWLERHTFPAEARLADPERAARLARDFLAQMLAAGTTTAAVYGTVHPHSAEALFAEAERLGLRLAAGKVLMDRGAPPGLLDPPGGGIEESAALIARWHGRGRLLYAVTPRFALSCSPAQLEGAGRLWREHPGTLLQTHLSETEEEVARVRALFPGASGYLDAYDRAGLVGPRAVFGHAVHATEAELSRLHAAGCGVAHCPSSNAFLGSGLFGAAQARRRDRPVRLGLGSDLGAGVSLSMLRTMGEAHRAAQLLRAPLSGARLLWLATAGGAEAMGLEERVGRLAAGMEADLVVLDPLAVPLLALRWAEAEGWEERLLALATLGDERCVAETWAGGRRVHERLSA